MARCVSVLRARNCHTAAAAAWTASSSGPSLPTSAYVHIPFCRKRCHYCDFTIVAIGENAKQEHAESTMSKYTDLVCKEIAASPHSSRLDTIYFGGGTPSLLPTPLLRKIMDYLESKHGIAPGAEVSMEMDPGTFDSSYLDRALECGVTRVSLGVQSFNGDLLGLCGRAHGVDQGYEAIEIVSSKLRNWSLDLISSLPHQGLKEWKHSLSESIAAQPSHISIYDLQVEKGTRFANIYRPGTPPLPSEEESAEFYKLASTMLGAAGYEHYEISNYAMQGYKCRHNQVYWRNLPYYGYGLGSTSYVQGRRFSRSKSMRGYTGFVEGLGDEQKSELPRSSESLEERLLDTVMLSLRLAEGIELERFESEFGMDAKQELCDGLRGFVTSGHAVFLDANREALQVEGDLERRAAYVRLSDPQGFLLSSEIISELFTRRLKV